MSSSTLALNTTAVPNLRTPTTSSFVEHTATNPDQILAQADGVLGAAGHAVTDPGVRKIIRQQINNEISYTDSVTAILNKFGLVPNNQAV